MTEPICGLARGDSLASALNDLIDARDADRQESIAAMGSAAGIDPGTVNQILNGSINCPPRERLAGFARVLGVSVNRLIAAAERDGCDYGGGDSDERASAIRSPRIHTEPIELVRLAGDAGALEASLTSETLERRPFGQELLVHTAEAIDLSRDQGNGFPLLVNHDPDKLIGRVRDVRLESGRLVGRLTFSENSELARQWRADIADRVADSMSARYVPTEFEATDDGSDIVRITRWQPREFSVVSVPADATVGIARSDDMPDDPRTAEIVRQAELRERKRSADLRSHFEPWLSRGPAVEALLQRSIADGSTIEQASVELLGVIGQGAEPLMDSYRQADNGGMHSRNDREAVFRPGLDALEKRDQAVTAALEFRSGLMAGEDRSTFMRDDAGANPYLSFSLVDLAREYARSMDRDAHFGSRDEVLRYVLERAVGGPANIVTGSLTNIFENVASKAAMRGWDEAEETWRQWVRIGSVPNFNTASRVNLSAVADLPVVPEAAEYPRAHLSDVKETITAVKYGRSLVISREAILADDLDFLNRAPMRLAQAGARKVGDVVYGIITANAALNQDSTALFHADHNNLETTGGPPTVTTVSAMRVSMASQTEPSGVKLRIPLRYLLVPLELEDSARVLAAAEFDPDATAGVFRPNSQRGRFEVVADGRLSDDSAVKWYGAGDPNSTDTVEIAFVNGVQGPTLERERQWSADGTAIKVRVEAGAAALDYRALSENDGA